MLTDNKLLYIKNIFLIVFSVVFAVVCRLISLPLPSVLSEWERTSLYIRNMTGYLRDNHISIIFFLVFVTSGLTSLLLGSLIHRKFDRNRESAQVSIKAGVFFLVSSVFFSQTRAPFLLCPFPARFRDTFAASV